MNIKLGDKVYAVNESAGNIYPVRGVVTGIQTTTTYSDKEALNRTYKRYHICDEWYYSDRVFTSKKELQKFILSQLERDKKSILANIEYIKNKIYNCDDTDGW